MNVNMSASQMTASSTGSAEPPKTGQVQLKIFFLDNTFKTINVDASVTTSEIIQKICTPRKGRPRRQPEKFGLFVVTPGQQTLAERRLELSERPVQLFNLTDTIDNGYRASHVAKYKILFRELASSGLAKNAVVEEGDEFRAHGNTNWVRSGQLDKLSRKDQRTWKPWQVTLDPRKLTYTKLNGGDQIQIELTDPKLRILEGRGLDKEAGDDRQCFRLVLFQISPKS